MLNEITLAHHPLVAPQANALEAAIRASNEGESAAPPARPVQPDRPARRALAVVLTTAAIAVAAVVVAIHPHFSVPGAAQMAQSAGFDMARRVDIGASARVFDYGAFGGAGIRSAACVSGARAATDSDGFDLKFARRYWVTAGTRFC